jgi:hypothetical protein
MSARNVLRLSRSPTLWEIEEANLVSLEFSQRDPAVLVLPRATGKKFFVDGAIVQLIASLYWRHPRLVVRDFHSSWNSPSPEARFYQTIDGVAALVFSTKSALLGISTGDLVQENRLENVRNKAVPEQIHENFYRRLLRTSKLEDTGPQHTYVSVDPKFGMPREFGLAGDRVALFQGEIRYIFEEFYRQTSPDSAEKRKIEYNLYRAVFEIFQNTYEHARRSKPQHVPPVGIRYLRFTHHIGEQAEALTARAKGFVELQTHLQRRFNSGTRRFLEISVGDTGPGILSHYLNAQRPDELVEPAERCSFLNQILVTNLTSKRLAGAGGGLPAALAALSELQAFVALRTDDLWVHRDFSKIDENSRNSLELRPVDTSKPLGRMDGTRFSILLDFSH